MTPRPRGSQIPMGTSAVARMVSLSYRQLDYWQRIGGIRATSPANGSGSAVQWSDIDVKRLHRIARASELFRLAGFQRRHFSTGLVADLWNAPIDETFVIRGDGCRLIVDPE